MPEGHQELCLPDPNVPVAPGSLFGTHFLSASETKSFCSTDLKLLCQQNFGSYSIFGDDRFFCVTL